MRLTLQVPYAPDTALPVPVPARSRKRVLRMHAPEWRLCSTTGRCSDQRRPRRSVENRRSAHEVRHPLAVVEATVLDQSRLLRTRRHTAGAAAAIHNGDSVEPDRSRHRRSGDTTFDPTGRTAPTAPMEVALSTRWATLATPGRRRAGSHGRASAMQSAVAATRSARPKGRRPGSPPALPSC